MALFDPIKRLARSLLADTPTATGDSVINAEARLGIGADNLSAYTTYGVSTVSKNRVVLDNAYRGSWLVGVAVDAPADDMTRAGIDYTGGVEPKDAEDYENAWNDLHIWQSMGNAIRWSRLYGGAIAVMLIDGQALDTPLRPNKVGKGAFKGLLVLDRWMVTPSVTELVTEFGPDMGMPAFYKVNANQGSGIAGGAGPIGVQIHYTRVIRFDGNELPFYARQTEQGWGQSVLERMWDRLLAYDSATQGASQLIFRAHLRTLQMEGLREAIAYGGKAMEGIARQVDTIRKFQSNDGLTLLDTKDKFETYQYAFGGVTDILNQLGEQMAGSLEIPMVRLYGQSPSGFSTGDTDLQQYEDKIGSKQERNMRRPVSTLIVVMAASLGKKLPTGWNFKFRPLRKMGDAEKATIAGQITTAVSTAETNGLISQKVAMQELKGASNVTGLFSYITDEDIEAAEDTIPNPNEMGLGGDPAGGGGGDDGGGYADESDQDFEDPELPDVLSSTTPTGDYAAIWQESKHKRGNTKNKGQFAAGSGGGGPTAGPNESAARQKVKRSTGQGNPNLLGTGIKDGTRCAADGGPLPPHIEALKLPPAWSDVRYAADPKAALLAQGRDAKGRRQSVYSQEFSQTQAAEKFARVKELAAAFNGIVSKNGGFQKSTDAKKKDAADCLDLVMKTGIRPGSDDDTGAEKQAYGATTLQGQHVVTEGDSTYLRFTGKKGVSLNLKIDDPEAAMMLQERAATAGPDGKLFPNVTDKSLLEHTKAVAGEKFKTKDFRTHLGTATAAQMVGSMAAPTDPKSMQKQVMQVAKAVSAKLGNTPTMALQAYIAPEVFGPWSQAAAAMTVEGARKAAATKAARKAAAAAEAAPSPAAPEPEAKAKLGPASARPIQGRQEFDFAGMRADAKYHAIEGTSVSLAVSDSQAGKDMKAAIQNLPHRHLAMLPKTSISNPKDFSFLGYEAADDDEGGEACGLFMPKKENRRLSHDQICVPDRFIGLDEESGDPIDLADGDQAMVHEIGHALTTKLPKPAVAEIVASVQAEAKAGMSKAERSDGEHFLNSKASYAKAGKKELPGLPEEVAELYATMHGPNEEWHSYFGGLPQDKAHKVFAKSMALMKKHLDGVKS